MGDEAEYLMSQGLGELAEEHCRERDLEITVSTMRQRYERNKKVLIGHYMGCACCGKRIVKAYYQQQFCPKEKGQKASKCKDQYWNTVSDKRRERARFYNV